MKVARLMVIIIMMSSVIQLMNQLDREVIVPRKSLYAREQQEAEKEKPGRDKTIDQDPWEVLPEAPIGDRGFSSAVIWGSKLVIWGGALLDRRGLDEGAILDLQKREWEELPQSPINGRGYHSTTLWGSKLVIWGGRDGNNFLNDGAILDLKTKKWEKLPEAPIDGRTHHSAALWGSKLVVWGGCQWLNIRQGGGYFGDGAILDLKTKKWKKLPEAPIDSRAHHSSVLWGSKLVVWGGMKGPPTIKFNDGAILNLETMRWEKLKAPIQARCRHSTALWGSKLVVYGDGYPAFSHGDGALLDIQTKKWEKLPESPLVCRSNNTAVLWRSKLVIWGGETHDPSTLHFTNDGAILDLQRREWQRLPESPIEGRCDHRALLWDSKLVIWGGTSGAGWRCDGAILDLETMKWKKLPEGPLGPRDAKAVVFLLWGSKLVIWGGFTCCDGAILDLQKAVTYKAKEEE
jgi:N-acetylneuraminic acid mutarotase